ncbi:MAG: hypothetical protein QM601_09540 [Pseudoxanthomonas sp.]
MILFLALCFVASAIAGACALAIFWPLTLVHLRDRHPRVSAWMGDAAFANPAALRWLLGGRYRELHDRGLDGLATPARWAVWVILAGLALAGLLWLVAEVWP